MRRRGAYRRRQRRQSRLYRHGVQWDPYALDYGQGRVEISDADWAKLYARLDFMRPAFIRVMTNTTSVVRNGRLDRMRGFEHLSHILGYCQSHGVTVMFGDWGGSLMDARAGTVNRTLLDHAAAYVAWLVGEKGYDCIRYYNLVNEPNGFWSAADGDFDLWAKAVSYSAAARRRGACRESGAGRSRRRDLGTRRGVVGEPQPR